MARGIAPYTSFNGGEIGDEILARTAIDAYGATASLLENIFPEAAGPMSKRPGLNFKVELGAEMYLRKWVYGIDQKYLMAFGNNTLKIIQDGGVIVRPSVTCTVTNGDFSSAIGTGWTEQSDPTAAAITTGGLLRLTSDGVGRAVARNAVTTSSPNVRHALNIVVTRGPVTLRVGASAGDDSYIPDTTLRTGVHSIAFTPTGNFSIDLYSSVPRQVFVDSCVVASAGDMVLATPWLASNFTSLRFQQSKDVVYVAGVEGLNKRRIERHASDSWSLVLTDEQDGPFLSPNIDSSITMKPSVTVGNGTLTCNRNYFDPAHVGALFKLTQLGQRHVAVLNGDNQFSEPVKVTGGGQASRTVNWTVSGTWVGTLSFYESLDGISWSPMSTSWTGDQTATSNGSKSFYDITSGNTTRVSVPWYYRVGFAPGDYTSGTATINLRTTNGSQTGIVRVTGYTSETVVSIEVLAELSNTTATDEWVEGAWSGVQGYPRAVALFDDRLWNGYLDAYWASQSSLYEVQETGDKDADAIWRNISTGEVGKIQWILPLSRIIIGTDAAEDVIRGSALDDPITPSNITVRDISSWGSADVEPEKIDARGLFIDRSMIHAMEIAYASDLQDYVAKPLTRLHKNIGRPGLGQICVSRRPETRVYIVRADGQILTKLYDPQENVLGWSRIVTPGAMGTKIISVESIPGEAGTGEDEVYFVTKRRIAGVYRYYLEQLGNVYYATAADANCLDAYVRVDQDVCNAVHFNGATQLTRGADLTGNADGKKGTVSFWANFTADSSNTTQQILFNTNGNFFVVQRASDGTWVISGKNSGGTVILQMATVATYGNASGWHHVAASWDLSAGTGQLYVNGVADLAAGATLTNANIDYTQSNHGIGGSSGAYFTGDVAQFYLNFTAAIDLSNATNLAKLISSSRKPVELGATGNGPSGTQPIVFLEGAADTFTSNSGSGGALSVSTGWLDDTTPPSPRLAAQSKVISGLDHLEGQTVAVWADGIDVGDYTVASGQITLLLQPSQVCVGLNYDGLYQSSRIAMQASDQAQLSQMQHMALILARSSRRVLYGSDFDTMDDLSVQALADGSTEADGVLETGISDLLSIPGDKRRDPRMCLKFPRPDPVTLAGFVMGQDVNQQA